MLLLLLYELESNNFSVWQKISVMRIVHWRPPGSNLTFVFPTTSLLATSTRRREIRGKHHGTSCQLNYHLEHDKNTRQSTKNQCIFRGFRFHLYRFVWCSVRRRSSSSLLWQYSIKCSGMCPFRGAGGPIWWQLEGFPPLYLQATLQLTSASIGADMIWRSTIHLCRSCILYNLAMVYIHITHVHFCLFVAILAYLFCVPIQFSLFARLNQRDPRPARRISWC